jgi:hypothetical protein
MSGRWARFCSSPSPTTHGLSLNVGLCRGAHDFVTLFWLCRRSDKCSRLLHGTMGLGMALPNPSFFFFAFVRAERLLSQTFNTIGQNACTVAAYLMSTCNMGCECSSPCVREEKWRLISCMYAAWTIDPLQPGFHYLGPNGIDDGNFQLCMCNTVVYSLLSACDACQSEPWVSYVFIVSFSSSAPLFICHQVVRIYVQLHTDTTSLEVSFPLRPRTYRIALTGQLAHSFPNPVPAGTLVPAWALLDVTVRCYYVLLFSDTY